MAGKKAKAKLGVTRLNEQKHIFSFSYKFEITLLNCDLFGVHFSLKSFIICWTNPHTIIGHSL